MTIGTKEVALEVNYGMRGFPLARVRAKESLKTLSLDYGQRGMPFVVMEEGVPRPEPVATFSVAVIMVVQANIPEVVVTVDQRVLENGEARVTESGEARAIE